MRPQFFIFGTNHPLQCGGDPYTAAQVETFRARIEEICHSHKIKFIAEEMTCDCLAEYNKIATVAEGVAGAVGIQHDRHIDLERDERTKLSIDRDALASAAIRLDFDGNTVKELRKALIRKVSNPVRECCWLARILDRILPADTWPVLLICGAEHVHNMVCLIDSISQDVVVVERDYEP